MPSSFKRSIKTTVDNFVITDETIAKKYKEMSVIFLLLDEYTENN